MDFFFDMLPVSIKALTPLSVETSNISWVDHIERPLDKTGSRTKNPLLYWDFQTLGQ